MCYTIVKYIHAVSSYYLSNSSFLPVEGNEGSKQFPPKRLEAQEDLSQVNKHEAHSAGIKSRWSV